MVTKRVAVLLTIVLLLSITACNLPLGNSASGSAVATAVAMTLAAQTSPTNGVTATLAPLVTATSAFTSTSAQTSTSAVPMVSVSTETNCRSGPGTVYPLISTLLVSQMAVVVGRDSSQQYWIIETPNNLSITCWLWGQYATGAGDTKGLPVIAPPPTLTPTITNTPLPTPTPTPTPTLVFVLTFRPILPCILHHNCPTATP